MFYRVWRWGLEDGHSFLFFKWYLSINIQVNFPQQSEAEIASRELKTWNAVYSCKKAYFRILNIMAALKMWISRGQVSKIKKANELL